MGELAENLRVTSTGSFFACQFYRYVSKSYLSAVRSFNDFLGQNIANIAGKSGKKGVNIELFFYNILTKKMIKNPGPQKKT